MSKIKRFLDVVEVGDKVQICPKWLRVVERFQKSDFCWVDTASMNTILVDSTAGTHISLNLWATLLGYTYVVTAKYQKGELLELRCEASRRTIKVSRLLIK